MPAASAHNNKSVSRCCKLSAKSNPPKGTLQGNQMARLPVQIAGQLFVPGLAVDAPGLEISYAPLAILLLPPFKHHTGYGGFMQRRLQAIFGIPASLIAPAFTSMMNNRHSGAANHGKQALEGAPVTACAASKTAHEAHITSHSPSSRPLN